MSVGIINDNLMKTSLVQQNQAKPDDIQRGQEVAQTATQREDSRQADQVVLSAQAKDEHGIRPDDEREKGEGRRKKRDEGDGEEQDGDRQSRQDQSEETGFRPKMRTLNITV